MDQQVTTNAGTRWATFDTAGVLGVLTSLHASNATHALLLTTITTSGGTTSALYGTKNAGRSWQRLFSH
jgi:photosystem II stability/assembly factor-like uncharacterized protein